MSRRATCAKACPRITRTGKDSARTLYPAISQADHPEVSGDMESSGDTKNDRRSHGHGRGPTYTFHFNRMRDLAPSTGCTN